MPTDLKTAAARHGFYSEAVWEYLGFQKPWVTIWSENYNNFTKQKYFYLVTEFSPVWMQ